MDEHLRNYLDRELTPRQRSDAESGGISKRNAVVLLLAFLGAYGCMSLTSRSLDQAVAEQDKREKREKGGSPFSKSAVQAQDGRAERAARERALREERERAEREAAKVWNSDPTSFGY